MIKVIGKINLYQNQRSISAFNFYVIDGINDGMGEYMHFMLETIFAHLSNIAPKQHIDKLNQQNKSSQFSYDQQRRARWEEIQSRQNSSNSNSNRNSWGGNNNDHNHNNRNSGNNNGGYNQPRNRGNRECTIYYH